MDKRETRRLLLDWQKKEEHSSVEALVSACILAGVGGVVKRELQRTTFRGYLNVKDDCNQANL